MTEPAPSKPSRSPNRARIVGFVVLGIVTLAGFAAPFLPGGLTAGLGPFLDAARESPWAPLVAIMAFMALATLGVPQIVLITAVVAAFGPWMGLLYSWLGKMLACGLGFAIGRRFGARILADHKGPRVTEFMRQVTRHGFLASALIRLVPTVPSVLVNIAAGATPMRALDFLAGTAIGSVPKMALMAFGGAAALEAVQHPSLGAVAVLLAVLALWVALAFASKRWLAKSRAADAAEDAAPR